MNAMARPGPVFVSLCVAVLEATSAAAETTEALTPVAEATTSSNTSQLQEIVVTAQRRAENLQEVPISVTALNAQQLEDQQISDVVDLGRLVPGMQVKQALTPMEITTTIRGVSSLVASINQDPAVGTYLDGVYTAVNAGSNTGFIDMERVEVLKGPQGTLFGRNTIGGAINITTAKPTDDFGGYVQATGGDYGAWSGTGMLNTPIIKGVIDNRFVYQHSEHRGYGTNFTTGSPTNTLEQDYYRETVKVTPNDNWAILLSGYYDGTSGFAPPSKLAYINQTASIAPGLPPTNALIPILSGHPGDLLSNSLLSGNWQDTYQDLNNTYELQQYGITATLDGSISDALSVKWITGYINTRANQTTDFDATPYQVLAIVNYPDMVRQFSQELQFYGDTLGKRLKWIGGLYYFHETGSEVDVVSALPELNPPGTPSTTQIDGVYIDNTSKSIFSQVTYALAPRLDLTAGVRYVIDDRGVTNHDHYGSTGPSYTYLFCGLANAPLDPNPNNCTFSQSVRYHYAPWTVALNFKPNDDTLLYGKLSQGYRSGAYGSSGPPLANLAPGVTPQQAAAANQATLAETLPVAPEKLLSPEIGAKMEFLDHTLRVDTALYYSSYKNIQLTQNIPSNCPTCTPVSVLRNSGDAHIWGGELELTQLLGRLELSTALGYANSKYVSTGPALPALLGEPLINSSKFNAAVTAAYKLPIGSVGAIKPSVTYSYRSYALLFTPLPPLPLSANAQAGFGLLDARINFEFANVPLTLALYGQNLTNKQYLVSAVSFAAPLNFENAYPGNPRTWGGSIRYQF